MKKISARTIVTVGMFTAVLAVLSIISIPMPSGVPLTLQTFAVGLCGFVLGYRRGVASTAIYILLGAVGVPVFAGMTGGPVKLVGYTGGFIWGFLLLTLFCGIAVQVWVGESDSVRKSRVIDVHRPAETPRYAAVMRILTLVCRAALSLCGLAACHLLGVLWYAFVADVPIYASFLAVSLPYIPKDVISLVAAYIVALPIRRAIIAMGNPS